MADHEFILDLAKVLIAAAWADGEVSHEELNALKDLLFRLPEITEREWAELEIFMESPVGEEEGRRLIGQLLDHVNSDERRRLVVESLTRMAVADGDVTPPETEFLGKVAEAMKSRQSILPDMLRRFFGSAMKKRSKAYERGPTREARIDDYLKNTVYYHLVSELDSSGSRIVLEEEQIRKLCLAAAIMARVAIRDGDFSDDEREAVRGILVAEWDLARHEARWVVEICAARAARGLDYLRLQRTFYDKTDHEERRAFVRCLFQVANSEGKTSHHEIEEIRVIARSFRLSHREFIEAKLTIPREDRGGQ